MFSVKRQWTGFVNIVSHTVEICTYVVRETFQACPNVLCINQFVCSLREFAALRDNISKFRTG